MVSEAERYKDEDNKQRDRVLARNCLRRYVFKTKRTMEDEKLKAKICKENQKKVLDKCNELISWLDSNQNAEKHEYEDKEKELKKIYNIIII